MIEVRNVSKRFISRGDVVTALKNISLNIPKEKFVCVIGPSGCGKTTLLNIIAGLEQSSEGEVLVKNKVVSSPGLDRAVVFQEHTLFPWKTTEQNIEFGLISKNLPKNERKEIVKRFINLTRLSGFETKYPRELSGGMKQRVAIARALAVDPDILLLDEPFGSLDAQTRFILQEELLRIWNETKKTILFVTHSIEEATYLADTVVVITATPGKVKENIDILRRRPRSLKDQVEYIEFLKKSIREEVEK
jgi:NitT/TauT family transport system ATP-binding protein